MIEIATCLIDLAEGAVWQVEGKWTRLAKIHRVWGLGDETSVGFYLWDTQGTEAERNAWTQGQVMKASEFQETFSYARLHVLNEAREALKVDHYISRTLSDLGDLMEAEFKAEGRELAERLIKLAKLRAGYDVLAHEWNEGCAGVGCCADTAEEAGDMLVADNGLEKDEIAKILSDREEVPAVNEPCVTSDIDQDLCPNGQSREECTEIDPCETCWQDQQAEGDMIEESMGLR